ncbi:MAG: outer membrane lipoprotein carrier protein LolA [Rhodothermales bacterium]|nr:outer membrane lipoprotein carrier protein LolA [Rhodothermales bacterium]
MKITYPRLLILMLLAALVAQSALARQNGGAATDPDAARTAERLQERYESLVSMRAQFVHTMQSDFLDSNERYAGTLVFENEKYRVETGGQTIVTDGVVTWVHNVAERQVLINDYDADESTFSLTEILRAFDREYEATSVERTTEGETSYSVLELIPRDVFTDYQSVRLWIRDSDGLVSRMRLVDLNDAVLEFELSELVFNPSVDAATFTFVAPEGTEIVDLRN